MTDETVIRTSNERSYRSVKGVIANLVESLEDERDRLAHEVERLTLHSTMQQHLIDKLAERNALETSEQEIVGYVPYNWTCNEWDKGTFEGYGEVLFDLSNGWEWRPVYGEKAPAQKASEPRLESDVIRDLACCDRFVRSSASEFCDECGYTNLDHLRKRSSSGKSEQP